MRKPTVWDMVNGLTGFLLAMFVVGVPFTLASWTLQWFHYSVPSWVGIFPFIFTLIACAFCISTGQGKMYWWKSEGFRSEQVGTRAQA